MITLTVGAEPTCSKFDYDEKLLTKMIKMEFQMEQILKETKDEMASVKQALSVMESKLAEFEQRQTESVDNANKFIKEQSLKMENYKNTTLQMIKGNCVMLIHYGNNTYAKL